LPRLVCPACGSSRLRRSRTRPGKERFLKRLGLRAFRCREDGCHWRGLLNPYPLAARLKDFSSCNYHSVWLFTGYIALILIIFLTVVGLISS